jgi:hypothetical protein
VNENTQPVAGEFPQNTETSKGFSPEYEARKWKPGQSGNPGGRRKRKPLTDAYATLLDKPIPNDKEGRTFAQAIAQAMVREAVKGKVNAAAEIADRIEGKTLQQIAGPEGGAIPMATLTAKDFTDDQLIALLVGSE